LAQHGAANITHLATADDKAEGLAPLAHALGLPLLAIGAQALAAMPTQTRSVPSLAARGTGSLAEAAALAGARMLNPEASLPLPHRPRRLSPDRRATCALALASPQGSLA
jgi:cobalt-precorrin 5A hydrolase